MPTTTDYMKSKYRKENNLAWCRSCREDKPQDQFEPSPDRRPFGLSSCCRDCDRVRKAKLGIDRYWKMSPEERYKYNRSRNLSKFGLTIEKYDRLLKLQNEVCAICEKPEGVPHHATGKPSALVVDHDRLTGKVRGLLCTRCNKGIGLLFHDLNNFRRAIAYLQRSARRK